MDNQKRIYGSASDIDSTRVQKIFDERAKRMTGGYTSVLLGDQNPEYATLWNKFEKESILPKLELNQSCSFIDIGCGIGRWGETVIPLCKSYYGCDFSEEMINSAKKRISFPGADYNFINCSFQEIGKNLPSSPKFDRGIIAGVCMYINDSDLGKCFSSLVDLISKHAILYLTETVAIEKRLTLNNFWSDAMKTEYSSIYRTPEEYNELYSIFFKAGFERAEQGFLPHLNNETKYSETDRWYTILKR